MEKFCDSEHTSASGTVKLARNKCPLVNNRVWKARKWLKTQSGAHCHVTADVSTDCAANFAVSATCQRVSGWSKATSMPCGAESAHCAWRRRRVGIARDGACGGLTATISAAEGLSWADDLNGGGGDRRRWWRKTAKLPESSGDTLGLLATRGAAVMVRW